MKKIFIFISSLTLMFLIFLSFNVTKNYADCQDPGLDGCNSPGSICIFGADEGVCDDVGNKNYACIKYAGQIAFTCQVRWECTCDDVGESPSMRCTSQAHNSGSSTLNYSCATDKVCIVNTTVIDLDLERTPSGEHLAGVKCADAGSASDGNSRSNLDPAIPPCAQPDGSGGCLAVDTSFGEFSTEPGEFIVRVFNILLAASGAIALLLIMRAGYKLLTSRGNPEGIKEGREQITAAVIGLLFLIFSFVFLQVLANDLLKIPS